jgi:hypothetical protein
MSRLSNVLSSFGVHVADRGYTVRGQLRGTMMGLPHGQVAYVIDRSGRTREVISIGDRGSVSGVMKSSVAVTLANAIERVTSTGVSEPVGVNRLPGPPGE